MYYFITVESSGKDYEPSPFVGEMTLFLKIALHIFNLDHDLSKTGRRKEGYMCHMCMPYS